MKISIKPGITLIEVLVTAGLTSIIIVLITYTLLNGAQSANINFNRFTASSNLDSVINNISQFALLAISSPATFSYSGSDYTSDSDTVIFQIPATDSSGGIVSGFTDTVVYDYNSTDSSLKELVVPNAISGRILKDKTIAQNVSEVVFGQTNSAKGTVIDISVTIFSTSFGKISNHSLVRSVRLRNQI